jgi:UTP--glucose-1-phosphate uridylyltransferase
MNIRKALITAANPRQRQLPLQTLVGPEGEARSALRLILEEAAGAGVEEFCIVVCPGDEAAYGEACGPLRSRVHFAVQQEPRGYGHAVLCGRDFCGSGPFLHLVGDHLSVADGEVSCARQLIEIAVAENASVSAVQPTRESLLTSFGAVGGKLVGRDLPLYQIEKVLEKPTPTQAEQELIVPGLRSGFFLCFFGMHVLGADIFGLLDRQLSAAPGQRLSLSPALQSLAEQRRYLAFSVAGQRYDIGSSYGLLFAQLALALAGSERDVVLTQIVELLAQRPR